ncbi:MAG: PHP domain-containing protein, partial [Clostridiales bacterium]|nr:PHP domain-containing protein [Clostridiales bacterium]
MKKFIISENGNFYKANLHCHSSDCSDGTFSLAELKKFYKEHGYSAVAFTDHNVLVDHSDMSDESFIALTGTEINIECKSDPVGAQRCYHLNLIAKDPHNDSLVCFNPEYIRRQNSIEYAKTQKYVGTPDFLREYSVECANKIIDEANKNGFLVNYNHPRWSLQTWEDYHGLRGLFGMEVYNGDCYRQCGRQDVNEDIYDDFLRHGVDIAPIAADDNHNQKPIGHPKFDSATGWVMIKADKLDYKSLTSSLEARNFYASNGPEIKSCYIEDGYIHVETSPCEFIRINSQLRAVSTECGEKKGDPITECHLKIQDG